jgi:uncharacterized protein YaeQ
MGNRATLYRFRIELSDVDRGIYEPIDFRAALHPSETLRYLITRVLAYALNFQEGIEFAPGGISDTEEPAIRIKSLDGRTLVWIEIGNPSTKKLHKATKSSAVVKVYAHKDPSPLIKEIFENDVHRASEIEISSLEGGFLSELEAMLGRDNKWSLIVNEGNVTVMMKDADVEKTAVGEVKRHLTART